jgi:hypothetical protein
MTYRVAVWGTGNIGKVAIRAISGRPDLELIGVGVTNPDKAGRDAGELAGLAPLGVTATLGIDSLIALKPDCVAYAGVSNTMDPEVNDKLARFLEAGINVSCTTSAALMHPPSAPPALRAMLEAAAAKGGARAYATGIEPGFAGDHLPLMLTMMSEKVRSIRIQEIFRYDGYPGTVMMQQGMGFGMPMEFTPALERPEAQAATWGPSLYKMAEHLGAKIDEIRCTFEKRVTPRTLQVAMGTVEAGTVGAIRFETIGVVNGRDAFIIEHVNRMADDIAPDWPYAARNGTYRVLLEGTPDFTCDLVVGKPETFSPDGRIATTMLMVNAIPYVCDAPPGLLTSTDLPFNTPRYVLEQP